MDFQDESGIETQSDLAGIAESPLCESVYHQLQESGYLLSTKEQIELLLGHFAEPYTPPGTDTKSVVHQWIHALHSGSALFAESRGISQKTVLSELERAKFLTPSGKFRKPVVDAFKLKPSASKGPKFIDLFAGIGGMRLGFEGAGGTCVFSSEFEKNAQRTYEANHGETPFGDITKISEKDIPDHDIMVAGFPCQPFSHAGLKLGIDDTRGTLFHDIARILEYKRPKIALLENVKGLISHDKGYTLQVILRILTDLGYRCSISQETIDQGIPRDIQHAARKMVLKSVDFGVPQNRQRIYIVLWRQDLSLDFAYPLPKEASVCVGDILEPNPDSKYTISDRLWAGHKRRKINNKANGKGFGYGIVTPESTHTNTISARYYKDGSEILVAQASNNPRKVTPREAARLQGFPENFSVSSSDVQAYKQFGNSVSVPVIKALAKSINITLEGH